MTHILDNNEVGSVSNYIKEHTNKGAVISISSPIFTIFAFNELRETLEKTTKFKFLFNEPTFIKSIKSNNKEVKEFHLLMNNRERSISEFSLEIGLKNNLDQNQIAVKCANFIKEKAEVKSSKVPGIITANAILVNEEKGNFFIQGNVGFSRDGLGYTQERRYDCNIVHDEINTVKGFEQMFDQIFYNEEIVVDVKQELLKHLENLYKENSPELLYYVTLYNLFSEKLMNMDDIARVKEKTGIEKTKIWNTLFNFQHDAVVGAIKKLELYNGCIIADSVGLGKTFEALAVIKYYELRNSRVLVLSPKKLRNNWTAFKENSTSNILADDRFNYDVLNHTDLSREKGLSGDIKLERLNWGNYDLVVIDESHNFRNDRATAERETRYQKLMNKIIKSGVKTKVLMLSATPVNTNLTDLKNQIKFITEDNDKAFEESANILSVEQTLRLAQQRFNEWVKLNEADRTTVKLLDSLDYNFFNLLNTVTIARSRKHIQKYYDTKDIGKFPERLKPLSIKTDIDVENNFPTLEKVNELIASLNLAVYSPMLYILPTKKEEYENKYRQNVKEGKGSFKQSDRERSIVNLMRVNILKRMESSIHSFRLTIERLDEKIDEMLVALDTSNEYHLRYEETEDEELDDLEIGGKIKIKVNDLDRIRMKSDLMEDKQSITLLLNAALKIDTERDAKLEALKFQIKNKIENPINLDNDKVIVFTSFSDTAIYLYQYLSKWLLEEFGLYTGVVTGSSKVETNNKEVSNSFEDILVHFSPKSNHMNDTKNQISLLIATDCISEGQNLQDCDYLINYDIHWNPVRIIQRFGRVDRIGSKNDVIQLVNFWPNMELDEYINLEKRVTSRMTMLDLSATGEDDLLNSKSKDLEYRKNQLKQLQTEVLDVEELQDGISITDLTLDDYLMNLDRFMKEHPTILEGYPTGIYAITEPSEKIIEDTVDGVIFCLKQKNYDANEVGLGTLYPYYLVYVNKDGSIHITNKNTKNILDLMKVLCTGKDKPIESLVKQFNKETKNGTDMDEYTELIEKAVFDIKGVVEKKGIASLFTLDASNFLDNKVSGLNDFELITFLVVKK